ncbi:hypothetical protein D3C76_1199040 [compost metagenome]
MDRPVRGNFYFFRSLDSIVQHVAEDYTQIITLDMELPIVKTKLHVHSNSVSLSDVQCIGHQCVDGQIAGVHPVIGMFNHIQRLSNMLARFSRLPPLNTFVHIQKLLVRIVNHAFDFFEAVHRFFIIGILIIHLTLKLSVLVQQLKSCDYRIENIDEENIQNDGT